MSSFPFQYWNKSNKISYKTFLMGNAGSIHKKLLFSFYYRQLRCALKIKINGMIVEKSEKISHVFVVCIDRIIFR